MVVVLMGTNQITFQMFLQKRFLKPCGQLTTKFLFPLSSARCDSRYGSRIFHCEQHPRSTPFLREDDDMIFKLDEDNIPENSILSVNKNSKFQESPSKYRPQSVKQRHTPHKERHGVDITPLSYVPGANIDKYLGNFNFFFIRETTSIREDGGLSGFLHSFVTEVLAMVRAHVAALGGNAMVAFFLTELSLHHNSHKNQGQCLINVGGDVVSVTYFKEDT